VGTEQVAGSGATSGIVVFKAQALAWVEVVDAGGVVQVRRNMAAGETVGVSGVLPLSVVVGRSDTTQVQVRGQAFDLLSIARDNVARFEVK
jgi:cytoskeleton protein RodZ